MITSVSQKYYLLLVALECNLFLGVDKSEEICIFGSEYNLFISCW